MNFTPAPLNLLIAFSMLLALGARTASAEEVCIYPSGDSIKQVRSRSEVPAELRSLARCFSAGQNDYLARPQDIELGNAVRSEDVNSTVGRIRLRWPRKVESVFGRTPLRALTDAANTLGRTLQKPGFPSELQKLHIDWDVVFLDADLPETQIPSKLVRNCHPGWMTPPASIYIVAQRVAGQCKPGERLSRVADPQLTRVLLHEMGHAVEYFLLDGAQLQDKERAEGFATWFEQLSAGKAAKLDSKAIQSENKRVTQNAIASGRSGEVFGGTHEDYARASLPFTVITQRRGLGTLMRIYARMAEKNLPFVTALEQELGWDAKKLAEEIAKYLSS